MQLFNCQSTLLRKDGRSVYRNILRIETDFVNCSGKYLLNVGPCLRGCVENAANDWFVCLYLFQRISIMLQRFNSVLLHDTLPVDLPLYLADDCRLVSDSTRRSLRSADVLTCVVPPIHQLRQQNFRSRRTSPVELSSSPAA